MGKPTVEGVRRHWKGKLATANNIVQAWDDEGRCLAATADRYMESRNEWKATAERYKKEMQLVHATGVTQREELQRLAGINDEAHRAHRAHREEIAELTAQLAEANRNTYKLICILDNVTHPERGKS